MAGAAAVRRLRTARADPARPGQGRSGRRVRAPLARTVPGAAPRRSRPRGRRPARDHRPGRQMLAQHLLYLHHRSPLTAAITRCGRRVRPRWSAAAVRTTSRLLELIERFEGPRSARLAERWFAEQPDRTQRGSQPRGVAGFAYPRLPPHRLADGGPRSGRPSGPRYVAAAGRRPGRASGSTSRASVAAGPRARARHVRGADRRGVVAAGRGVTGRWPGRSCRDRRGVLGAVLRVPGFPGCSSSSAPAARTWCYGNDWRRLPVDAWLDLMNEREHSGGTGPPPGVAAAPAAAGPGALRRRGHGPRCRTEPPRPADRQPADRLVAGGLPDGASAERLCAIIEAVVGGLGDQSLEAVLQPHLRPGRAHSGGPPRCSVCPSAPTGGTWPRRSRGHRLAVGGGDRRGAVASVWWATPGWADTGQGLSTFWPRTAWTAHHRQPRAHRPAAARLLRRPRPRRRRTPARDQHEPPR